ncbi:MAG TPA: type IVB secretion system protein IcmJDotN [Coxiellaceae bacterium]|nr:type IVB secretion system protein IcmJDotN [Coxiellaceae bacterium]
MQLINLPLISTEENWRLFMLRRFDPGFTNYQQSIFRRDDFTCLFCGFRANQHMDVINLDSNYSNNHAANLATACPFCSQCFFLESVGMTDYGGGTIIYCPEMTQNEVNALSHELFCIMANNFPSAKQANNIFRDLKLRGQLIEKEMGEGLSNPNNYGRLLVDARIENFETLMNRLEPKVRLLPSPVRFAQQIEDWSIEAYKTMGHQKTAGH